MRVVDIERRAADEGGPVFRYDELHPSERAGKFDFCPLNLNTLIKFASSRLSFFSRIKYDDQMEISRLFFYYNKVNFYIIEYNI